MDSKIATAFAPWRGDAASRRDFRRWSVRMDAVLHTAKRAFPCTAHDLSPGGARIEIDGRTRVKPGAQTRLELPGFGRVAAEVRHVAGKSLGLMFTHDDADAAALAGFLIAHRPARPERRSSVDAAAALLVRGVRIACRVKDISRFGARLHAEEAARFAEEQEVLIRIDGHGSLPAVVRRIDGSEIGLILLEAYAGGLLAAAR